MLTVIDAAKRSGRNPETIRRWIRSGRLKARRIGNQHVIDEEDLAVAAGNATLPLPKEWQRTFYGESMPDVAALVRRSRTSH